ncbi:hypothetical protein [Pseudonocardia sp. TRM90224]|uniref:hypothetical protein n=1 Tax=Pseudonocardia sp. TRM90224 TaxID=2812678 RepID=UPI001E399BDB|nr:hypothetical protein [Pseudonocardia sp. TRM90224]
MSPALSHASRVCIVLLLLGGALVAFGQVVGIAVGSAATVELFGNDVVGIVSTIAGLAGILAFLRLYTADGRAAAVEEHVDVDAQR